MKTLKLLKEDRKQIIDILLNGGIVAFPTDTVYGLGCTINKDAIKKIYEAKGRSFDKPLLMMCSNLKMIEEYACAVSTIE